MSTPRCVSQHQQPHSVRRPNTHTVIRVRCASGSVQLHHHEIGRTDDKRAPIIVRGRCFGILAAMTRIARSPSMLRLIPKYPKESTHCIIAATTKFNSERLPSMDSARLGEVIALKFENCAFVVRPSPFHHMHEGVVQFEQWRPKKQSMDNDRKASLTQRDTVSQTTSRRHAAKKIVKLVFSPTNSHPLQLAFSVALSPYLRTFDAFRRPFKAHGQYYSVARSQLPQGAPLPPGGLATGH